jgi:ABC-2 type transport system permease protein
MIARTHVSAGLGLSTFILVGRTITQFRRTPQMIVMTLVNGIVFVLIFRFVFGGAIKTGNETYVNLLVPGVMLVSLLYAAAMFSVGVAEEKTEGFFDRLKSLPIPRAAPLLARVLATTALLVLSLAVSLAVGLAVGFEPDWTGGGAVAAGGIAVMFAFALAWVFVALGLKAANAQVASGYTFLITPLAFISGAFIPVGTMPAWLEPIARHQPFNVIVEASRGLVLANYADAASPLLAVAWIAASILVFAPYAVWLYTRT